MNQVMWREVGQSKVISLGASAQPAAGKTTQVLFETANGRLVLVGLAAGYEWQQHATPNHALVQVFQGACEFQLENQTQSLRAGDVLEMPPGLPHSVKATEASWLLLTLYKPAPA